MNWITSYVPPRIKSLFKRESPENLWIKCPESGQMVFQKDVEANLNVIPGSGYHLRLDATSRLKSMFDEGKWVDVALPEVPVDPLKFRAEKRYVDQLKDNRTKTGMQDAVKIGFGRLEGAAAIIAAQDFDFMGGSLGMAVGEALVTGMLTAIEKKAPFILSLPPRVARACRKACSR